LSQGDSGKGGGGGSGSKLDQMKEGMRSKIQESIDRAYAEHKHELFKRRIDLARQGVRNFELKRMVEAVKAFETYLTILHDWKGAPEGGLNPSYFDIKKDLPEMLLISGIYWDLAKLFDRTRNKEREFRHYIEKFIVFTKGMPYQPVASETLRKYIRNDKPVHKDVFKSAYRTLTGSNCFIATSLVDVCDDGTIHALRDYRDSVLLRSLPGCLAVVVYQKVSPPIAWALDRMPEIVRALAGRSLDRVARGILGKSNPVTF